MWLDDLGLKKMSPALCCLCSGSASSKMGFYFDPLQSFSQLFSGPLLLESCPPSGCGRQTTHSTAIGKWCFHRKTRTSLPDRQERHVPMIEYILNFKNQDLKRKRFKALERLNLTKFLVHKCKALC